MVQIINENDISKYRTYLKLNPNYTASELESNFRKASKTYHPSMRRNQGQVFDNYVVAYEVLGFMLKNRRGNIPLNSLIRIWNNEERPKVEAKLIEYKKLTLDEYLEKIGKKPVTFRVIRLLVLGIIFTVVSMGVLVIFNESIEGRVSLIVLLGVLIMLIRIFLLLFKRENVTWKIKNPFQDLG